MEGVMGCKLALLRHWAMGGTLGNEESRLHEYGGWGKRYV